MASSTARYPASRRLSGVGGSQLPRCATVRRAALMVGRLRVRIVGSGRVSCAPEKRTGRAVGSPNLRLTCLLAAPVIWNVPAPVSSVEWSREPRGTSPNERSLPAVSEIGDDTVAGPARSRMPVHRRGREGPEGQPRRREWSACAWFVFPVLWKYRLAAAHHTGVPTATLPLRLPRTRAGARRHLRLCLRG